MKDFSKIALIFPGQGSQYYGMGGDLYENFPASRTVFDRANKILGYNLCHLCFDKDEKRSLEKFKTWLENVGDRLHLEFIGRLGTRILDQTRYSQPAIFTASVACYEAFRELLKERGLALDFYVTAGHSLGEYAALYAAGAIDLETGVRLVKARGEFMQSCGEEIGNAGLLSILSREKIGDIEVICKSSKTYTALYNTDFQIVVGGYDENLKNAKRVAEQMGLKAIPLKVSGPFHTYLMKPAAEKMETFIKKMDLRLARRPIIANTSAQGIVDPRHITEELVNQIHNPILWKSCVDKMIASGVELFIEIGPGKVLTGMISKINPNVKFLNMEDKASMGKAIQELETYLS
ncbi:MAG: ACP S-malonyltransferase [Thermodesulfobacteriota bacterium]|nr:ACP S-malonyltransferase [Thermodesulfobacteriota bacterium]